MNHLSLLGLDLVSDRGNPTKRDCTFMLQHPVFMAVGMTVGIFLKTGNRLLMTRGRAGTTGSQDSVGTTVHILKLFEKLYGFMQQNAFVSS